MPKLPYTYKALTRYMGKALHRYRMIADGDRIAVGISGGKDSFSLMWLLDDLRKRAPVKYDLVPIYIDPGFEPLRGRVIIEIGRRHGWETVAEYCEFGPLAHSSFNRENPCFLCSRLRRKHLFVLADRHGCNKIALGHNKDDLIETLFMNMFYAGEISTMLPVQEFFGGKLTVIRPLAFADEDNISRFVKAMGFRIVDNPCPSAGNSRRGMVKSMLKELYKGNRKIKGNIFRAMQRVRAEYLLK